MENFVEDTNNNFSIIDQELVNTNCADRWCNCIVLHDFRGEDVKWQEWFEFALTFYTKHNLEPTRLGVSGIHYGNSTKTLTFKVGKQKLYKYSFAGIEYLSLILMPNKSDDTTNFIIKTAIYPNWKNFKSSILVICFDEILEPFNQQSFKEIAIKLHPFTNAKYGYYYYKHLKQWPELYPSGGYSTHVSQQEEETCDLWEKKYVYNTDKYYRTGNLRDIYKLNFLSKEHLDWKVKGNQNLEEWIKSDPNHGALTELSAGFWSWYVEEYLILSVHNALIPSGIIICI